MGMDPRRERELASVLALVASAVCLDTELSELELEIKKWRREKERDRRTGGRVGQ